MRPADPIEEAIQQANCKASDTTRRRIWQDIAARRRPPQTAGQMRQEVSRWRVFLQGRLAMPGVLVVGVIAGLLIAGAASEPPAHRGPQPGTARQAGVSMDPEPDVLAIRAMAAAQDVKGLAAILSDGQFESRLLAANFLAKMAPLPALETVSMHAAGELRVDRRGGNLRLYSTGHDDWLELADSTITVHTASSQQRTTLVRLTHSPRQVHPAQIDLDRIRKNRADLEKRLASPSGLPDNVDQLRKRIDTYNQVLDLMDRALYASPAGGGLRVENRLLHREADLFPSDHGVRAEWHGVTVDANGVTLQNPQLAPVRTEGPAVPPVGWRDRFDQVYSLADGEVLRWVRPPFIPERQYHMQELSGDSKSGPSHPAQLLFLSFRWDGTLHDFAGDRQECTLESLLQDLGRERGLRKYEMGGPADLRQLRLGGDWIVREESSFERRLDALERALESELERRIRFTRKSVEREVIVVRGRYGRRLLEGQEDADPICLFAESAVDPTRYAGREKQTTVAGILDMVGERFNRPVVLEAQGLDETPVRVQPCLSYLIPIGPLGKSGRADRSPARDDRNLDPVLANLARQTSLEFSRQTRPFDTWLVSEVARPSGTNADRSVTPQK